MTGFVKPRYAILGNTLRIASTTWRIIEVYGHTNPKHVAWWFKVGT